MCTLFSVPIFNIEFNEATRLAFEAVSKRKCSNEGTGGLLKKNKENLLLHCKHTKLAGMHNGMYSLGHGRISGCKLYGTPH